MTHKTLTIEEHRVLRVFLECVDKEKMEHNPELVLQANLAIEGEIRYRSKIIETLQILLEKGLLETPDSKRPPNITDKGIECLKMSHNHLDLRGIGD